MHAHRKKKVMKILFKGNKVFVQKKKKKEIKYIDCKIVYAAHGTCSLLFSEKRK